MVKAGASGILAIAVLAACLGCAAVQPMPRPAEESALPTPSAAAPSEPAPALPALEELTLTPGGLGTLRVGHPVDVHPSDGMVVWDPDGCDGHGQWRANYPAPEPQDVYYGDAPFEIVTIEGRDSAIAGIRVLSKKLLTAEGIGMGSTREELVAAYPGIPLAADGGLSEVYVLDGAGGQIHFEVRKDDAYTEHGGLVYALRIVRPNTPAGPAVGTDADTVCPT